MFLHQFPLTTVESIWCEIFHRSEDDAASQDTQACIVWMYGRMEYGCRQYPGFFMLHSLGFMQEDKIDGTVFGYGRAGICHCCSLK